MTGGLAVRAMGTFLLIVVLAGCATAPPGEPDDICSIFREKRTWHHVALKAHERWETSTPIAMAIMHQESSFEHDARPPRRRILGFIPWKRPSSAYGYAQALDGTWETYIRATGEDWRKRTDFADAIDFVHWYMRQAVDRNAVAVDDARALYLNYHEGLGGFRQKTWRSKPWLGQVARRVHARAQRYTVQYAGCRDSLRPTFWQRWFG